MFALIGIGKLIDRKGSICVVAYFDSPTSEPIVHEIESDSIELTELVQQTRVYHFDEVVGAWEIGRLLDDHGDSQLVQFPNGRTKHLKVNAVFVRWACPIEDPTLFLANRINESPRFSEGRGGFVRSQTRQRAASMGMSALLSAAVELEAHQIEVVRRILQDPVQRYLLADEVGLGKTIEAGMLIRQCIIDMQQNCSIVVIVPTALVRQWRSELESKFLLGRCLDRSLHIVALDDNERIRALLPAATMLVIDEAHHLTSRNPNSGNLIYHDVAAVVPSIERVLLLSATPALHNERGFLEMLHLLDPETYPLDGVDAFRKKIKNRQALAEIVAGLTPENVLYLDYSIDQLVSLFPDDELLQEHTGNLRCVVDTMPEPDDPILVEAIESLRAHLSEVYRLHRRILRHRRRSIGGLTPDRAGVEIVRYRSRDRAALTEAIDDWRFDEAIKLDTAVSEEQRSDLVSAFWQLLDRSSQYAGYGPGIIELLARQIVSIGDPKRFEAVYRCLVRAEVFEDRTHALLTALAPLVRSQAQCVVFCSDAKTADMIATRIRDQFQITVYRHDPQDDAWTAFAGANDHSVLVCDRRAEEGLNLQGGKKVVVHYDLPLNPNRVEQRLGRVDRYGSGESVRSLVLACEDDPLEMAWIGYLDNALRVFDRSVASLQYLIEQTGRDLARAIFIEGAEAIVDLTASGFGDQGFIEREIKLIDQQDALDSLGMPPTDLVDELSEVDDDWQSLARDTAIWLEQTLQFGRADEARLVAGGVPSAPFRYVYSTSRSHTLIPLSAFMTQCAEALDLHPGRRPGRTIQTIPYTFRRRTALNRSARNNGVGLLRYGDALISGLTAITEADDRGRSFAMWRFASDHVGDPVADFFFRFDFILEVDTSFANKVLEAYNRGTSGTFAAVRRRGDTALAAFYRSIWLDRELAPVEDEALLERLCRPYNVDPDRSGAFDLNLNARRWQRLQQMEIPELAYWGELCGKARAMAEKVLRSNSELVLSLSQAAHRAAHLDQGRLSLLRARAKAGVSATESENAELAFEEQLTAAVQAGINAPRVRLDTIGAVFISASQTATDRISGGI